MRPISYCVRKGCVRALAALMLLLSAAFILAGCPEDEIDLETDETDIDPPTKVTNFAAVGYPDRVELVWENPSSRDSSLNKDFAGVLILKREGELCSGLPVREHVYQVGDALGSDTVVFIGSSQSFTDQSVEPGRTYFYCAITFDEVPNYGARADSNATPGSSIKPRIAHTVTLLDDGRVLIAGGVSYDGPQDTAEIYDPATGSFTLLDARMSEERFWHTATKLPDGRVLIAGGQLEAFKDSLADADIFDPGTMSFIAVDLSEMSTGRAGHNAVALSDGQVVLVGGTDGQEQTASADLFDEATGFRPSGAALAKPRSSATATLMTDGLSAEVLVCGGFDGETSLASCQIYNPASDTFTDAAGAEGGQDLMSESRVSHTATALIETVDDDDDDDDDDDAEPELMVLLAGGDAGDLSSSRVVASAELFDWEASPPLRGVGDMTAPRSGHAAARLDDGRVLMLGGVDENILALGSAEIFDPSTESFTATGGLNFSRTVPQAVALPDGRVLVVGGNASTNVFDPQPLSPAEIYDPTTGTFSIAFSE